MIDRGALVLAPAAGISYRGVFRPTLDAQVFTGRRGKDLRARYAAAVVAGEGVVEDLDEAIELCRSARKIGLQELEVIVFEIPQEPPPAPRALPIAPTPPAEGLTLLGYDLIETLEPYWSPLAVATPPIATNEFGLIARRDEADVLATSLNAAGRDDPLFTVRVWTVPGVGD